MYITLGEFTTVNLLVEMLSLVKLPDLPTALYNKVECMWSHVELPKVI